ncbi:class I SAM-dependent methyltransferase [Rhizohabitans arisaemae]|uniref:class I SAM-dependent methyltransferase n=1 Tax=Rhizohabitans arisaemae TaxID=2720610 RepID=UPI0024B144CF|nr:class I SAM-dependent methyltransferase [Rhizohabitans arisaemae]
MDIVNTHQAHAWNGYEGRHWADRHDRYDAMVGGLNGPLFEGAVIERAHRVLDIGCGAGATTRIAARSAPDGHAFGVDLSEPMLERARRTAEAEGLGNVTFEQGDAQVHPFPEAHFDVAVSRGGIMYFADPVAAFGNIGRALKPGGRLAFVCGRDSGEDEAARLWQAMARHVPLPDPAEDDAPGPVNFTNRDHIVEVLTKAGFTQVTATPFETVSVFGRDAEDAAEFVFGWGPVRHWLRDSDPAAVARAREAVVAALRPFEIDGAVRLTGPVWRFTARVG